MIKRFVVGPLQTNCYIYGDESFNEYAIIDPGEDGEMIWKFINENHIKIKYIIFTHCHFDHIMAANYLKEKTGAPMYVFEKELPMLSNDGEKISKAFGYNVSVIQYDSVFNELTTFSLGSLSLTVLHTPGHSVGSVCLYSNSDNTLFSGDTLFYETVGRCEDYECLNQLTSSVKEKCFVLPDETRVFPGHGEDTTIGHEKTQNPYLNGKLNG